MHSELKVFVPHGVEGVAVDRFGTEVAAVDGHAQNIQLDAGAAGTVTGTNVLPGHNLSRKGVISLKTIRRPKNIKMYLTFFYHFLKLPNSPIYTHTN